MEIKDLIGAAVEHKMFGQGMVEGAHENYIEVFFSQKGKKSKFSYPFCFQGFLKLVTDEKKADIEADLVVWRIKSGAEQKEELETQYLRTQQAIAARRLAAEKKKLRDAQKSMNRSRYHQQEGGNFIALACGFKSRVSAVIAGEEINAKSIMKAPVIENAEEIEFIIKGENEKEVAEAITLYFETKES